MSKNAQPNQYQSGYYLKQGKSTCSYLEFSLKIPSNIFLQEFDGMRFFYILLLFTTQAFATAELYLAGGESATIFANTNTNVYCDSIANTNCTIPIKNFEMLLNGCKSKYQDYYCFKKYLPTFKKNYPTCTYSTLEICMSACTKEYSGDYCAESCQQLVLQ